MQIIITDHGAMDGFFRKWKSPAECLYVGGNRFGFILACGKSGEKRSLKCTYDHNIDQLEKRSRIFSGVTD